MENDICGAVIVIATKQKDGDPLWDRENLSAYLSLTDPLGCRLLSFQCSSNITQCCSHCKTRV